VTVTQPPAATVPATVETTLSAPVDITLPDVTGANAELAQEQLEKLGLKKVEFASANPKYGVVLLARNWTVTGMEPAGGTVVKAGDTVILKVYKD
jgi:beta-lactam-binding protein with PASTA domain